MKRYKSFPAGLILLFVTISAFASELLRNADDDRGCTSNSHAITWWKHFL